MPRSRVDQVTQRRRGVGLIAHDPQLSHGGYTLIAPQTGGGKVYLIDSGGEVVHQWQLPVRPGRHAVILPNGNLGYNGNHVASPERYAAWSMWHGGDFYEVTPGGEVVSHQHAPVALANGRILVFDNGNFRAGSHVSYSRVVEIDPDTLEVVWSYADPMVSAFYTPYMGQAQRLPNGNTHITESATGRLFEVTPEGEVVWEFILPWFAPYPDEAARRTGGGWLNTVFQTFRYSAEQLPWLARR